MEEYTCNECGETKSRYKFFGNSKTLCAACWSARMLEGRARNASKPKHIYILVDPRDSRIYYVGCTNNPHNRMFDHYNRYPSPRSQKDKWIQQLKADGVKLQLVVIETVPAEIASEREIAWIRKLGSCRAPLMNDRHFVTHRHIDDLTGNTP